MPFGAEVRSKLRCRRECEVNTFIGRRRELDEIANLLSANRLVTLTGVGGVGKSRVAHRVAAARQRAYDEFRCIDLSEARDPELLTQELQEPDPLAHLLAEALGLHESATCTPMELLGQSLAPRRLLLLLDNCEHLLPTCAVLIDTLLRQCPRLQILVTSREPLRLTEERVFQISPLPTPDPGARASAAGDQCESVALFVSRAQAVVPTFALTERNVDAVAELCRWLDGLPLAIELAAGRLRMLAPAQMLQRSAERFAVLAGWSRGVPERQQTLRGCVGWSFELCSKSERLLWARLSVFTGGFELDAAQGVCADEQLPAEDVAGLVAALVDKSILISENAGGVGRYRMLETIRDYGQDKLQESGERLELHRRHREWCQ